MLLADLRGGVRHETLVVGVRPLGQRSAEPLPEPPRADVAVTQPDRIAAVVGRRIAEHVEEERVHVVAFQRFGEDLHRVGAVVATVDARRVEAVVGHGLAVGLSEEPLRMGVVHGLLRLAQVEASDHADAMRVGFREHFAEHVAARPASSGSDNGIPRRSDSARRCRPCRSAERWPGTPRAAAPGVWRRARNRSREGSSAPAGKARPSTTCQSGQ